MKKILLFFILILITNSCNTGSFVSDIEKQRTGLDFRNGKWLLNEIDCPKDVYFKLTPLVNNDFGNYLKERFYTINQVSTILLPKKVKLNPTKREIQDIKKGTLFDYFINVKAEVIKEELGSVDLTNHKTRNTAINRSYVVVEVYDLNLTDIVYSKKMTGTVRISEGNNSDINFSKNSKQIIISCYKKIFKDIKKKSILK